MPSVENVSPEDLFYHGTRADLRTGDFIEVGHQSNFGTGKPLSWVYFSRSLEAATWGAELAKSEAPERIYIVQPTGPFVDDPNLTNKRFPGNPTQSFRTREPLLIVGEIRDWPSHSLEAQKKMKADVARLMAEGADIID